MFPLKIGISLASLRQPLRQALRSAARLGAQGVEIDARGQLRPAEMTGTAVRELRKLLGDMNLKVCAVSYFTRRGYNDEEELDRRIAGTKEALRMAYELGCPIVSNFIGRVPPEPEGPRWKLLLETMHDLARYGDHIGAQLAARTGSEDGATLARLLDVLPEGALAVDFDPAALIIAGHPPLESLEPLAKYVKHVRARDAARDFAAGRGLETQLGRGTADFPTLAAALGDFGYNGYFTIERQQSADPQTDIANAVQFLKNML